MSINITGIIGVSNINMSAAGAPPPPPPVEYYSNLFPAGGALTTPASSLFAYGTDPFTVEAWIRPAASSGTRIIYSQSRTLVNYFVLYFENGNLRFLSSSGGLNATSGSITAGTWQHVAVTRDSSSTLRLFIAGSQVGSSANFTVNFDDTTLNPIGIAGYAHDPGLIPLDGYISNLRVVKGTALYTGNYSVPTAPLTAVSGTSLLTCQSSTIIDNSGNSVPLTNVGSVTVNSLNPFN